MLVPVQHPVWIEGLPSGCRLSRHVNATTTTHVEIDEVPASAVRTAFRIHEDAAPDRDLLLRDGEDGSKGVWWPMFRAKQWLPAMMGASPIWKRESGFAAVFVRPTHYGTGFVNDEHAAQPETEFPKMRRTDADRRDACIAAVHRAAQDLMIHDGMLFRRMPDPVYRIVDPGGDPTRIRAANETIGLSATPMGHDLRNFPGYRETIARERSVEEALRHLLDRDAAAVRGLYYAADEKNAALECLERCLADADCERADWHSFIEVLEPGCIRTVPAEAHLRAALAEFAQLAKLGRVPVPRSFDIWPLLNAIDAALTAGTGPRSLLAHADSVRSLPRHRPAPNDPEVRTIRRCLDAAAERVRTAMSEGRIPEAMTDDEHVALSAVAAR